MQRPYIYSWKILGVGPLLLKKTFSAKPCFSSLDARLNNSKIKQKGYQFIYADTLI